MHCAQHSAFPDTQSTVAIGANEVPPRGGFAPLWHRGDSMPAQDIADRLVGHRMSQVGQCSYNPVVPPGRSSREPSEPPDPRSLDRCAAGRACGAAWSRRISQPPVGRYQARMVSGLARRATGCRPLRPKRLPISARVARSRSESRQPGCRRAFKMRFSAARYSCCSRSSWLTKPVT